MNAIELVDKAKERMVYYSHPQNQKCTCRSCEAVNFLDHALALLRQPEGEFTKKFRARLDLLKKQLLPCVNFADLYEACDRLDRQAEEKEELLQLVEKHNQLREKFYNKWLEVMKQSNEQQAELKEKDAESKYLKSQAEGYSAEYTKQRAESKRLLADNKRLNYLTKSMQATNERLFEENKKLKAL